MHRRNPWLLERRRALRSAPTPAEGRLWSRLRNRRLGGLRFRRQWAVDGAILDFYCPAARLGVELDGGSHFDEGGQKRDRERDAWTDAMGIRIVRFRDADVFERLEEVLARIWDAVGAARGGRER